MVTILHKKNPNSQQIPKSGNTAHSKKVLETLVQTVIFLLELQKCFYFLFLGSVTSESPGINNRRSCLISEFLEQIVPKKDNFKEIKDRKSKPKSTPL